MVGKKFWIIPDGHMNDTANGDFVSHEAICILNLCKDEAVIHLTIYFEDDEPLTGFKVVCKSERSNHIRLDKILNIDGKSIPRNTPYSIMLESNVPVIAQHSRMDVSQKEMALMTSIPFCYESV